MKTLYQTIGLAVALAFVLFAGHLRAQDDTPQAAGEGAQADNGVSFQTFYNQLAGQGTWINTNQYGYVFQPTENDPNWRPYMYGHWVNTDAGMTWVSDESFGWATYHYGRWVNLNGEGWVWVPGYTWAPAWVSWREGDDDVGWAPLPPDTDEGIDYYNDDDYFTDAFFGFGFHIGDDCDVAYGIGPLWYNFCPIAYIGDPYPWRHFRDPRDNFAFINHTRNVTNLNYRRDGAGRFDRVTAAGPSVAALNARARTPIAQARLADVSQASEAGLRGNTLAVYAPRMNPATLRTARPDSVSERVESTSVNRGTNINDPLVVNSRIKPAGATSAQIHEATVAQGNVPASARVATTNTHFARSLAQPLTSLRTGERPASTFGMGTRSNTQARTSNVSAPVASTDARYTGEAVAPRATFSSSGESRYTGEAIAPRTAIPSQATSTYHSAPSYFGSEGYHPGVYHASTPLYHPQASAPAFHYSAPAYHPESSFHSFAPAPQPHYSAPAAHFSSGGFGGGARSFGGGGGAVSHASSGGGHAGGGGAGHR